MARQFVINLTGKIGPTVHYKLRNTYVSRSLPCKYKQTKATKARAAEFGKAAKAGATLRSSLTPIIPFPQDNKMQTRFVTALLEWMRSDEFGKTKIASELVLISNIQFTDGTTLQQRWQSAYQVSFTSGGLLELSIASFIPKLSIKAPAGTVSVECKIAAASCMLDTSAVSGQYASTLNFNYDSTGIAAQTIQMPFTMHKGNIVIVAMSLDYMISQKGRLKKTTNTAFMPAGVIAAMYF